MSDFYNFVKNYFSTNECTDNTKYSSAGHTFCFNTDDAEGIYWFYEGENFTIDIHDVFIKKKLSTQVFPVWIISIPFIHLI